MAQPAEARDALEALAADRVAKLPFDEEWLVSMGLLAETARALDDAEHAPVRYELLLPYGDRVALSYPEISTGAVARYLGLLAAMTKRWDDAERHFEDALATNKRIGARPWVAHTQHDYAHMLLARDAPGDRDRHARWLQRRSRPTGSSACPPTGQAHRRSHPTLVGSSHTRRVNPTCGAANAKLSAPAG